MARRPEFPQVAERIQRDYPASSLDALPGERDMASRYGVSRPTVSKALALLAKQGVLKRHTPGTPSATNEQPVHPTATVVTYVGPVSGAFHAPLLLALLIQASDRGYHLRVIPVPDGDPIPDDVVSRVAGSHAVIGGVPNVHALEQSCPKSARLVLVGLASLNPALASRPTRAIHVDLENGMAAAIQHAKSQGQKGPVWVIIEAGDDTKASMSQLRQGHGRWPGQQQEPPNLIFVRLDSIDQGGRLHIQAQLAAATPPPAAIVCGGAALALAVRDIVRGLGQTNPAYRSMPITSLGHDPLMQSLAPEIVVFDFALEAVVQQVLAACFLAPPPKHASVIAVQPCLASPFKSSATMIPTGCP